MGQIIQGPWKPLSERPRALPSLGTSQCTIITLRSPSRREGSAARPEPSRFAVACKANLSPAGSPS